MDVTDEDTTSMQLKRRSSAISEIGSLHRVKEERVNV